MSHSATSFDETEWDMAMNQESIIWDPIEVRNEVILLGLEVESLIDCVRYAELERSFVTHNDTPGFAGLVVFDKAGRALRERFCGEDWVKDDSTNQCAIENPDRMLRVVPCNFDEFAGNRLVQPTNKSPKGEVSRVKSMCNRTAWLPGIPRGEPVCYDRYQTWLLGIFTDDERPTTAELSLPIDFDGNQFTDFGRRILLITNDDDGPQGIRRRDGPNDNRDDGVEVVDIHIRRR